VIAGNQVWVTTAIDTPDTPENIKKRLTKNTGSQPLTVSKEVTFRAVCLDKATGRIVHDVELFSEAEPQWVHQLNSYASPTPVIAAGRLYCHFGTFGTACVDTATAKVLWTQRGLPVMHENGPGSSPVLHGDKLIFHCDGSDVQYIVALDKDTGKVAWKTDRSGKLKADPQLRKAYGTPLIIDYAGQPALISPAADWLYAYHPDTGKELWRVEYPQLGFSIVPRPVEAHGMVYFCTSFMQSMLLAVRVDGKGEKSEPHIAWQVKGAPRMTSPLVVGNEIYLVSDEGGVVTCLDAKTGDVHYRERIDGKHCASPLYVDGRILLCGRDGVTTVLSPGTKFKVLAANPLADEIMASPAAVDGAVYIRTSKAMYRIEAKKQASAK
jgi:outer membrane protein assembly factor BamB